MVNATAVAASTQPRRSFVQRPLRILLVSSSGGVLLDLLALRPWWSRHHTQWAAVKAPDTEDVLSGQQVHWVAEQSSSRPLAMFPALARAWILLRRLRPDIVVSAGSGVAVPIFVMARVCRIPSLWIETLNLVGSPGTSSRICSRLAAKVLVQRPELVASRPNSVLIGELY